VELTEFEPRSFVAAMCSVFNPCTFLLCRMTYTGKVACCVAAVAFICLYCAINSVKERFAADIKTLNEMAKD
jgi:hypothetical protein